MPHYQKIEEYHDGDDIVYHHTRSVETNDRNAETGGATSADEDEKWSRALGPESSPAAGTSAQEGSQGSEGDESSEPTLADTEGPQAEPPRDSGNAPYSWFADMPPLEDATATQDAGTLPKCC